MRRALDISDQWRLIRTNGADAWARHRFGGPRILAVAGVIGVSAMWCLFVVLAAVGATPSDGFSALLFALLVAISSLVWLGYVGRRYSLCQEPDSAFHFTRPRAPELDLSRGAEARWRALPSAPRSPVELFLDGIRTDSIWAEVLSWAEKLHVQSDETYDHPVWWREHTTWEDVIGAPAGKHHPWWQARISIRTSVAIASATWMTCFATWLLLDPLQAAPLVVRVTILVVGLLQLPVVFATSINAVSLLARAREKRERDLETAVARAFIASGAYRRREEKRLRDESDRLRQRLAKVSDLERLTHDQQEKDVVSQIQHFAVHWQSSDKQLQELVRGWLATTAAQLEELATRKAQLEAAIAQCEEQFAAIKNREPWSYVAAQVAQLDSNEGQRARRSEGFAITGIEVNVVSVLIGLITFVIALWA